MTMEGPIHEGLALSAVNSLYVRGVWLFLRRVGERESKRLAPGDERAVGRGEEYS